ncbi:hypothetical protein KQX54_012306 [Cotesia glomerata]|uniref:Uncharacterized protein n=1 Tax=Cotesia glomerata TaxID=32391 RepID=A0AAV7IVR3_COTGL|nr:hypothetical protein KQX54_012306 [Cotesia glomerata]
MELHSVSTIHSDTRKLPHLYVPVGAALPLRPFHTFLFYPYTTHSARRYLTYSPAPTYLKEEREKTKEEVCRKEVASAPSNLARSASGPGAAVVGCLVGVYPCSSSTRPRGPGAISHLLQSGQPTQAPGCRSCCCIHNSNNNNNNNNAQNSQPVLHNAHRSGLSLRVARVASITSVRAAPYTHPHHQPLTQECRCREETGGVTGGSAPILGSPMLFVPLAVPTFPATLQPAASRPAHQPHHQPLEQRGLSVPNSVQQQPARFNSQSHPNFGRQRTNTTTTSTADNQVNIDNSSPQSTLEHQKEQHHQRAHPEDPQLLQVITPNKTWTRFVRVDFPIHPLPSFPHRSYPAPVTVHRGKNGVDWLVMHEMHYFYSMLDYALRVAPNCNQFF